jgi:hypothetical protein
LEALSSTAKPFGEQAFGPMFETDATRIQERVLTTAMFELGIIISQYKNKMEAAEENGILFRQRP